MRRASAVLPRSRGSLAIGLAAVLSVCALIVAASGALPLGGAPTVALGAPRFVDETASAGIDQVYGGGFEHAVGGGVAMLDCSGDGKPDLYIAGGGDSAALYRNDSPVGGALRFTRLRDPATDLKEVNGAYPIDIDGDGITDIVVLRNGENVLLRGLGGCRFERANVAIHRGRARAVDHMSEIVDGLRQLRRRTHDAVGPRPQGSLRICRRGPGN